MTRQTNQFRNELATLMAGKLDAFGNLQSNEGILQVKPLALSDGAERARLT